MADSSIDDNQTIQILLTQYSCFRAEIDARISRSYQLTGIALAAGVWLLDQPHGIKRDFEWAVLIVGLVWPGLVLIRDISGALQLLEKTELAINKCAGSSLLDWKIDLRGLGHGFWYWIFRHVRRWR